MQTFQDGLVCFTHFVALGEGENNIIQLWWMLECTFYNLVIHAMNQNAQCWTQQDIYYQISRNWNQTKASHEQGQRETSFTLGLCYLEDSRLNRKEGEKRRRGRELQGRGEIKSYSLERGKEWEWYILFTSSSLTSLVRPSQVGKVAMAMMAGSWDAWWL